MSGRVAATGDDIDVRLKHYANSLSLMHTSGDTLAGIGLGRYPDAYAGILRGCLNRLLPAVTSDRS